MNGGCRHGRFEGVFHQPAFAQQGRQQPNKIKRLFDAAGFGAFTRDALTAVKLHFGEPGSDSFVKPVFVRAVVDKLREAGAKPFLTDTNTLYSGGRHNSVDHALTALRHGFGYEVTGAPTIIADGLLGENVVSLPIKGRHFSETKIAGAIARAEAMIVCSHFKGHMMAGFGGAIKNLAMGCAPGAGKREQHDVRFEVNQQKCVGCGLCAEICPEGAATVTDGKASIDRDSCVGCGECHAQCPERALEIDWKTEMGPFMERMTEYALGAVSNKQGRVGYFNFLIGITPDCDCASWSDAPSCRTSASSPPPTRWPSTRRVSIWSTSRWDWRARSWPASTPGARTSSTPCGTTPRARCNFPMARRWVLVQHHMNS